MNATNIDARPRSHCCRGKAKNSVYSEYVSTAFSYLSLNSHAPFYIAICGLFQTARFSEEKNY
jgi:hypothetical protein